MKVVALYGLIIILSAFLIFHLFIVLKIIPYKLIWGGRLTSDKSMYRFEIVSILTTVFFLIAMLDIANILHLNFSKTFTNSILWIMTVLFLFNTVGNIMSKNKIEQRFFTPITILLTLFSLILALTS